MAGVAVGTFYNYYPSKDHLFMEIYVEENEQLKRKLMESVDPDEEPVKFIKKFLALNFEGMSSNPILKEWYNRDLFSKLEKDFYEQDGFKSISEFMNRATIELIKKWKAGGKLRDDLDDDLVLAILNSIFYIDFHKKDIGIQHFPHLIDYIVEFVMKGLSSCPK
jgi:AcrR family transcriptional regulator